MAVKLAFLERAFYFSVWISLALSSIVTVVHLSNGYRNKLKSNLAPIAPSWWHSDWLYRDDHELDWHMISGQVMQSIPYLVAHVIASHFVRRTSPGAKFVALYYILSTSMYLIWRLDYFCVAYLTLLPLATYCAVVLTRNLVIVWMVVSSLAFASSLGPFHHLFHQAFAYLDWLDSYVFHVTVAWAGLKCISFANHYISIIRNEKCGDHLDEVLKLYGYIFYMPTVTVGPVHNYHDFSSTYDLSEPTKMMSIGSKLWFVVRHSSKFMLALCVKCLSRHFCYFSVIFRTAAIWYSLSLFQVMSVSIYASFAFYMTYYICYGYTGPILTLDNIKPHPYPKCVARIHLFSQLWRWFDHGLYTFMHRNIYVPILSYLGGDIQQHKLLKKLASSVVCFSFVYLWHGQSKHIFVWTLLNFIGITVEAVAKAASQTAFYSQFESAVSYLNLRRIKALATVPFYFVSVLSTMFFMAGYQVGMVCANRFIQESDKNQLLALIFFIYCGNQVSIDLANW